MSKAEATPAMRVQVTAALLSAVLALEALMKAAPARAGLQTRPVFKNGAVADVTALERPVSPSQTISGVEFSPFASPVSRGLRRHVQAWEGCSQVEHHQRLSSHLQPFWPCQIFQTTKQG